MNNAAFRGLLDDTRAAVEKRQHAKVQRAASGGDGAAAGEGGQKKRKYNKGSAKYQALQAQRAKQKEGTNGDEGGGESVYRDRATERRTGRSEVAQELASVDIEMSKFLGGDEEHTHLVKGLDFALLSKVRSDMNNDGGVATVPEDQQRKEKQGTVRRVEAKAKQAGLVSSGMAVAGGGKVMKVGGSQSYRGSGGGVSYGDVRTKTRMGNALSYFLGRAMEASLSDATLTTPGSTTAEASMAATSKTARALQRHPRAPPPVSVAEILGKTPAQVNLARLAFEFDLTAGLNRIFADPTLELPTSVSRLKVENRRHPDESSKRDASDEAMLDGLVPGDLVKRAGEAFVAHRANKKHRKRLRAAEVVAEGGDSVGGAGSESNNKGGSKADAPLAAGSTSSGQIRNVTAAAKTGNGPAPSLPYDNDDIFADVGEYVPGGVGEAEEENAEVRGQEEVSAVLSGKDEHLAVQAKVSESEGGEVMPPPQSKKARRSRWDQAASSGVGVEAVSASESTTADKSVAAPASAASSAAAGEPSSYFSNLRTETAAEEAAKAGAGQSLNSGLVVGSSTAVATLAALEKPNEMAMMKSIKGLAAAADRIQARKAQRGDIAKSNLASIERSRGDIKGFAMDAFDGNSYGEDFDVDFDGAREAAFASVSLESEGDGNKKNKRTKKQKKEGGAGAN